MAVSARSVNSCASGCSDGSSLVRQGLHKPNLSFGLGKGLSAVAGTSGGRTMLGRNEFGLLGTIPGNQLV